MLTNKQKQLINDLLQIKEVEQTYKEKISNYLDGNDHTYNKTKSVIDYLKKQKNRDLLSVL